MEVKFFRLVTGEDILAQVVEEPDDPTTHLIQPMKVLYISRDGKLVISMAQWVFSHVVSKQDFRIHNSQILTTSEPDSDLVKYYFDCIKQFEEINNQKEEEKAEESPMTDSEALKILQDILEGSALTVKKTLH